MIVAKYFVYLLKSTVSNKTYIGYTVDIRNRINSHNGLPARGKGARRTRTGRPWKVVMYVSFEYERTAMQYEFCIQHTKKYKRTSGIANKMKIMKALLRQERICSNAPLNSSFQKVLFFSDEESLKLWNSI